MASSNRTSAVADARADALVVAKTVTEAGDRAIVDGATAMTWTIVDLATAT